MPHIFVATISPATVGISTANPRCMAKRQTRIHRQFASLEVEQELMEAKQSRLESVLLELRPCNWKELPWATHVVLQLFPSRFLP